MCIFLGYAENSKGYKCFSLDYDHCYYSRDVIFNEQDFPLNKKLQQSLNDAY
jgi:hypothetical protein